VGKGNIVEKLFLFSSFGSSKVDTFIYNKNATFNENQVSSVIFNEGRSCDNLEANNFDDKNIKASIYKMKNEYYPYSQLYAGMLHFAVQLTVKTLRNGHTVGRVSIYGISINYHYKEAKLYKMNIDYTSGCVTMQALNREMPMPI